MKCVCSWWSNQRSKAKLKDDVMGYLKQGIAGQCTRGQPFTREVPYMELKLTQNFFPATLYFLPLGRYWSAAKSVSVWAQSYSSTWLIVMIWVSCQGYILPLSVQLALAQSTSALRLVAVFLMVAGRLLVASLLPDWIWLQEQFQNLVFAPVESFRYSVFMFCILKTILHLYPR